MHKIPLQRGITAFLAFVVVLVFVAWYRTPRVPPAQGEFAGVSLTLDYATTTAARERGLGGRTNVPENYGMLFVFPNDAYYGFWMKDMHVPLDLFWLDAQGQVVSIAEDIATSTYPNVFYPSAPARYVLETAAGFAARHTVATGTPLLLKSWPKVSE